MATKTFSSRADATGLAYAEAVARKEFGMSFGQYCGTVLVEAVNSGTELPRPPIDCAENPRKAAIARIKGIAAHAHDAEIGRMSDSQIKDLLASRYE